MLVCINIYLYMLTYTSNWDIHACFDFLFQERLCYTAKRTGIVGICAIVQAFFAWRSSVGVLGGRHPINNALLSFLCTYIAGWVSDLE